MIQSLDVAYLFFLTEDDAPSHFIVPTQFRKGFLQLAWTLINEKPDQRNASLKVFFWGVLAYLLTLFHMVLVHGAESCAK